MRHAVERQSARITACEIRLIGQYRPQMFGSPAARERRREFNFEMHHQRLRISEQQLARRCVLKSSAPKSEYQPFLARQHQPFATRQPRVVAREPQAADESRDRLPLSPAKLHLALALEDLGNRRAGLRRNHIVNVDEVPAQPLSDNWPHSRLSRAHESGKDNAARHSISSMPSFFWRFHSFQYKDTGYCLITRVNVIGPVWLDNVIVFDPLKTYAYSEPGGLG